MRVGWFFLRLIYSRTKPRGMFASSSSGLDFLVSSLTERHWKSTECCVRSSLHGGEDYDDIDAAFVCTRATHLFFCRGFFRSGFFCRGILCRGILCRWS
jgi:hypothetical protein